MSEQHSLRQFDPQAGAVNLLENCLGAKSGETVAMVAEDPSLGFYDTYAAQCITEVAEDMGCTTEYIPCPLISGPDEIPDQVLNAMDQFDHVIFQARAGDQVRFTRLSGGSTKTMSYAVDIGFLGSSYCTINHALMVEVLSRFEAELNSASTWRIRCPLGTDVSGSRALIPASRPEDFTLGLFPIPIFRPVLCSTMNGRVAVAHWLMATQNRMYDDDFLALDDTVTAVIEAGRIAAFEGPAGTVDRIKKHYHRVSSLFDIDADIVHSWHTGIHPAAFYPLSAAVDINRWGAVAFANPRYTHFHTCGNYAPGEISWSIFDATIELDGKPCWKEGRFVFLDRPDIAGLAEKYGYDAAVFQQRYDIGI